jgi:hypothetical protein
LLAVFVNFALIYLPIGYIFDFAPLSLSLLGLLLAVTVGYALVTEMVKLAYFKKLIKPRIRPMLMAQYDKVKSKISDGERELLEARGAFVWVNFRLSLQATSSQAP